MPKRKVARLCGPCGLARIHYNDAFGMLNSPGINRLRVRPGTLKQHIEQPPGAVTLALLLGLMDLHRAGLYGMNFHPVLLRRILVSVRFGPNLRLVYSISFLVTYPFPDHVVQQNATSLRIPPTLFIL